MYIWETAGETLLRRHNIEPPPNFRQELGAWTLYQTAVYFNKRFGLHDTTEDTMDEICKMVEEEYFYKVPAKPHIRETLEWLSQQGAAMAIVTASERYHVEAACRRLGIWDYFQKLFTCTETGLTKHSPEIYERAASELGAEPRETVVFEDALHAVKTAANGGFWTVAVDDTYNRMYTEELKESANWFLTDYRQTKNFLTEFFR